MAEKPMGILDVMRRYLGEGYEGKTGSGPTGLATDWGLGFRGRDYLARQKYMADMERQPANPQDAQYNNAPQEYQAGNYPQANLPPQGVQRARMLARPDLYGGAPGGGREFLGRALFGTERVNPVNITPSYADQQRPGYAPSAQGPATSVTRGLFSSGGRVPESLKMMGK